MNAIYFLCIEKLARIYLCNCRKTNGCNAGKQTTYVLFQQITVKTILLLLKFSHVSTLISYSGEKINEQKKQSMQLLIAETSIADTLLCMPYQRYDIFGHKIDSKYVVPMYNIDVLKDIDFMQSNSKMDEVEILAVNQFHF